MKDGIPKGTGNSRFLKAGIPSNITLKQMVDMLRAGTFPVDFKGINPDGWDVIGTPVNKQTLLPDTVCDVLHIDRVTSTVGEAFLALPGVVGKGLLNVKAYHWDGTPYANLRITGISGIAAERCYTDANGALSLYVSEGSYTIGSADNGKYFDTQMLSVGVRVQAFKTHTVTLREQKTVDSNGILTYTSSISKKFSPRVKTVDAFLVGGGGKGGDGGDGGSASSPTHGYDLYMPGAPGGGGGGGSAGQCLERKGIVIEQDVTYPLVVGAQNGTSSAFGINAMGGINGENGDNGADVESFSNYGEPGNGGKAQNGAGNGGMGGQNGKTGEIKKISFFDGLKEHLLAPGGGGGGGGRGGKSVAYSAAIVNGKNGKNAVGATPGDGGAAVTDGQNTSSSGSKGGTGKIPVGSTGGAGVSPGGGGGGSGSIGHGVNTHDNPAPNASGGTGGNGGSVEVSSTLYGAGGNGGGGGGACGGGAYNSISSGGKGGKGTQGVQGIIYVRVHYA